MPALNMLLRQYSRLLTSGKVDVEGDITFGPFTVKQRTLLNSLIANNIAVDDASFVSPPKELQQEIFAFKATLKERATRPIDYDTKGLSIVGLLKFPINEQTGSVSPIVTSAIDAIAYKHHCVRPPIEYVREALKDIDVILVPDSIAIKQRVIVYLVELGLDIEVIGVKKGAKTLDLKRVNRYRKLAPTKHETPLIAVQIHHLPDCLDGESIRKQLVDFIATAFAGSLPRSKVRVVRNKK